MILNRPFISSLLIGILILVSPVYSDNDDIPYRHEFLHYSPGHSQIVLSFPVKSASPLKYNGSMFYNLFLRHHLLLLTASISHANYTRVYNKQYSVCNENTCYNLPTISSLLDSSTTLTCFSGELGLVEVPLHILPYYSEEILFSDILLDEGTAVKSLNASNNVLTGILLLNTDNQSIDNLSKGLISYSNDRENTIQLDLHFCKLIIKPSQLLKDETGEDFTPNLLVQTPKKIPCDLSEWSKTIKDISTILTEINLSTNRTEAMKLYKDTIKAVSRHDWNFCSLYFTEILNITSFSEKRYSTECYFERLSEEWASDPCCNGSLKYSKCCLPDIRNATAYKFQNAVFKGNQSFVEPACEYFSAPFNETSDDIRTRRIQLLQDYSIMETRRNRKESGCSRIDTFQSKHAENIIKVFNNCVNELYGRTFGVGNPCLSDADCKTSCNTNLKQCIIPWENPAPYITQCFNASITPFIKYPYFWMSNVDYQLDLQQLTIILKGKYTNKDETCVGPKSVNKTIENCLDDKYCNWKTCKLFPTDDDCSQLCTEAALPENFCGLCIDKEFGHECKDISYPRGCMALTANDIGKCKDLDGTWSASLQQCFLPGIDEEDDCIVSEFCPPQEDISIPDDGFDEKWNRTLCPGGCFDSKREKEKCVDENCDHPCCDKTQTCNDQAARDCVCKIDAFCCDNWDETCDRKVVDDGCVNCNCVRRKWEPELNHKNGLCRVFFTFQERCEDPYYGNATWWIGRTWSEGRFANKERCNEGLCVANPSLSKAECEQSYTCEGSSCFECRSKSGQEECSSLSTLECLRCENNLSTCKLNQTEAQCSLETTPCKSQEECSETGFCNDDVLKKPFGGCFSSFSVSKEGEPFCGNNLVMTKLGCLNQTIRDPKDCQSPSVWMEPKQDKNSCENQGIRCREVRKRRFDLEEKVVYTYGKTCETCMACGGTCEPLFQWRTKGVWKKGTVIPYEWLPRQYLSHNILTKTFNVTALNEDLNAAMSKRITENIYQELTCRYSYQSHILEKVVNSCSDPIDVLDNSTIITSKTKILDKPLYAGHSEVTYISPLVINVSSDTIAQKDRRLDMKVYLTSMFEYMKLGSKLSKNHGFVDFKDNDGFPKGYLTGDGIQLEFFKAETDELLNITLENPLHICLEKPYKKSSLLNSIFPNDHLGTLILDGSSRTFKVFDKVILQSNETMICFNTSSSVLIFPVSIAANEIPLRLMALVLMIIFMIGFVFGIAKIIYMSIKDKTQIKGYKILSYVTITLCFASYAVQMFFIFYLNFKRTYPDDALFWDTLEWPTRILFSLSIALFIFSKDDETRFKVCDNRLTLWPVFAVIFFTIGGAFYYQLYSFFPSASWDDAFIYSLTHIEKSFLFMISISSIVMCVLSTIWTCANKDVRSLRIELAIFTILCLGQFVHVLVWYSLESGWQGSDFYMKNYVANLCLQIVIMLFMLIMLKAKNIEMPFEYINIEDEYYDEDEQIDTKYLKLLQQVEDMARFEISKMPKEKAKKHFSTLHKKIDKIVSDKETSKAVIEKLEDSLSSMDDDSQKMLCKSLGIPYPIPAKEQLSLSIQRGKSVRKDEIEQILAKIDEDSEKPEET